MRKQTKIAALVSAAALLAIGASMTSLAAGWHQLGNGDWEYLGKDGEPVSEQWKRSGDNWYYLGDEGIMLTDTVIDTDAKGNIYYVDSNGVRVADTWVAFDNEDGISVNDNEVDTLWMYFGSNGKAYKAKDGQKTVKSVVYGGGTGRFLFDDQGYMLSGWYRGTIDDEKEHIYYLGDENQGWALTGWQYLEPDDDYDADSYEDYEWYYFQSNGRAYKAAAPDEYLNKYIGGKYYSFDNNGVMEDEWIEYTGATPPSASPATAIYASVNGSPGYGWVYDQDDEVWYYLVTYRGKDTIRSIAFNSSADGYAAKSINGKTYLFDKNGKMQVGLQDLREKNVCKDEKDELGVAVKPLRNKIYYFNKTSDKQASTAGQMVTGKVSITEDGETNYYYFAKAAIENDLYSIGVGEAYTNAIVDGILYDKDGKRVQAEDGNTYATVVINGDIYDVKKKVNLEPGKEIVVSNTGKVKTSGKVKIDGVTIEIDKDGYVKK